MNDITKYKQYFPLRTIGDVEALFKNNLKLDNGPPNLTLLSLVLGLIEHSLTTLIDKKDLDKYSIPINFPDKHRKFQDRFEAMQHNLESIASSTNDDYNEANNECNSKKSGDTVDESVTNTQIPEVEFEVIETLYKRFVDQIKTSVDFKDIPTQGTKMKVKMISDILWSNLTNTYYKDRAHLQSIFNYLTTSKLDCFGLAFAVISGCQILNMKNVYLALSEDHAWVMIDIADGEMDSLKQKEINDYKENKQPVPICALHETCEVTWHGKANSDKRGQPVTYKNCWLYTNGYAVKCDVSLSIAALVSSINPSINSSTDSESLSLLQQRLLWLLFDSGNYFPMSLGNLGELEDICPTKNAPLTPLELFHLGIEMSRKNYNDSHVYPYTYLASYYYRHLKFKDAINTWADASYVMTKYNYSRDDEEIYKEFADVANELIPAVFKALNTGGFEAHKEVSNNFLDDPVCLALILRIYDNICVWEEGSSTPVLHIGWAKPFVATILKFSDRARAKLKLLVEDEWEENKSILSKTEVDSNDHCSSTKSLGESKNPSIKKKSVDVEDESEHRRSIKYKIGPDGNVYLVLWSQKLQGTRPLLQANKLSTSEIQLHLTAQSQCVVRGRSNNNSQSSSLNFSMTSTRSKRLKR